MQNVSNKIEPIFRHIYGVVSRVAADHDISFVVVGAAARNLVLHHVHGTPIQRATKDIDFGLQVPNWESFYSLRAALLREGFSETKMQHRLLSPDDITIDIVPFGAIRDANDQFEWPNEDDRKMSVLGFQEACDNSEIIRIQSDPIIDVPVATPAGMALLKLIAWTDREQDLRAKDATDLRYVLLNYERIPRIINEIYDNPKTCEQYAWDVTLLSAHLLGKHSAQIAAPETMEAIDLSIKNDSANQEKLVLEMCGKAHDQFENTQKLLEAFLNGFGAD